MTEKITKVVICDDHAIYRQGVKYILASKPDMVVIGEAEDGLKLIRLLKHVQPDIVLLDINMPVMDGTVALPIIKKEYPNVKVLVLSMQNTSQMIKIMMSLGADGYLTKNDDEELIYKAIKECVNNDRFIDKRTENILIETIRNVEVPQKDVNKEIFDNQTDNEDSTFFSKYKWIFKSILSGIILAIIVILILYIYYTVSNIKDPIEKYSPTTQQNN